MMRGLRLALRYLEHPEVQEIPFVMSTKFAAKNIRAILEKAEKEAIT
jgi:hypothetical protein